MVDKYTFSKNMKFFVLSLIYVANRKKAMDNTGKFFRKGKAISSNSALRLRIIQLYWYVAVFLYMIYPFMTSRFNTQTKKIQYIFLQIKKGRNSNLLVRHVYYSNTLSDQSNSVIATIRSQHKIYQHEIFPAFVGCFEVF